MKRTQAIVWSAVAFYSIVMAVVWTASTSLARKKTVRTLLESCQTFANVAEDAVDSVLWYSSSLVFDELGGRLQAPTVREMQEMARRHHLDEINIVSSNGVIVASNFQEELGYNFADNPVTAEFLDVLEPGHLGTCYRQPYRRSFATTNHFCKYYAVAFPDRSGLLQLGLNLDRIAQASRQTPAEDYLHWNIGLYGHFEAIDENGNGFADTVSEPVAGLSPDKTFGEGWDSQLGRVFTCDFTYAGLRFRAVVPEREFHEQRNLSVFVGGIALAALIAFFCYLFVRLSASSAKLEALHAAADARTAADLALARVIQMSSLPHTEFFRMPYLDSAFEAATYPAREVGGDFYGMFELSDHRVVFLVADVAGKGVPAAMFMHVALNTIQTGFRAVNVVTEAVAGINNYLCEHNEAQMFVTVWFGVLDPATGEVEYVNAGHNRPYVVRKDGRVERVDGKGGLFLGMFPRRTYRSSVLKLEPGDRLFLYTDGVTEAMDKALHPYGAARLERVLAENPAQLCKAVKSDVDAHVADAERSDDLTMLELAWYGQPPCAERTFAATESALGEAVAFLRTETKLTNAKQVSRLLNAADEMLSNVVNYSGVKAFSLVVENIPGRCRVTISDDGPEYNPLTHADPDTHAPLQRRDVGGLGILMAKKLVNSIGYRREGGRNVLTLVQIDYNAGYRKHS